MASPRVLPHHAEAELALLGSLLLQGSDALDEIVELVGEDDFYQPRARAVFRAMRILEERGEPIDVITLEAQLRRTGELALVGGIEALVRLDRHATAHHVRAHAQLVAQAARLRALVVKSRDVAEKGLGELEDVDDFIERAGAELAAIVEGRQLGASVPIGQLVQPVFESIVERQRGGTQLTGVPTGFARLDELTAGLQPTDLIILAARPSMGKTALALNIAANAAVTAAKHWHLPEAQRPPRYPVLFFSLEMGRAQLTERILSAEARIDAMRLRQGSRLLEAEFRGLCNAGLRVAAAPLEIDDTAAPSILELRARARRWRYRVLGPPPEDGRHRGKLGLVMVDYLQLGRGGAARYSSREQEISEISRGLKAMAKELELPVIALSQLNRAVDGRADHRPQLSDLRESGAIEQDADVILFVYREERYLGENAPEERVREVENKAEVIVGKQRNGPIGVVPLTFVKANTRFENPSPEHGL